jgi:hypothetical protein
MQGTRFLAKSPQISSLEMVNAALQFAPQGIAVLGPQEVWALAQLDSKALVQQMAQRWKQPGG